jgi:L-amino acid N-acyltransferase YncA
MDNITIIETNAASITNYGMCGYKNLKNEGYLRKIEWIKRHFNKGLRYKILHSAKDGAVGGIEYIPGEYNWRAISAKGYIVIHCIYIMSRAYKGKGYGVRMLHECISDAKKENMHGVAVVTRKGTFMVGRELFIKEGFILVDTAPPDFELLVYKHTTQAPDPHFTDDSEKEIKKYSQGLVLVTSDQCPYAIKAVNEISETALNTYHSQAEIIILENACDAQKAPCAFGSFCILYDGNIIADHPISSTRFHNIMQKLLS